MIPASAINVAVAITLSLCIAFCNEMPILGPGSRQGIQGIQGIPWTREQIMTSVVALFSLVGILAYGNVQETSGIALLCAALLINVFATLGATPSKN